MTDQHVYIRHKDFAWIPAQLIDQDNNKKTATVTHLDYTSESQINADASSSASTSSSRPPKHSKTVTVQLKDYPNGSLPLQNVVDNRIKVVADMIELSFLHEAAILYNLKARHVQSMPYTRTSDIVIAVNPYQWITSLYTEQNRTRYSRALVWEAAMKEYDPRQDLPPHVYETSALSYKGLSQTGIDQSILVSGESGAGKTETVKICMNHLASVVQQEHTQEGNLDEQDQTVIKRVLDSNPLLEAFGNAKTRRNDNSSRFGKYIQLQFQKGHHNPQHLTLMGSECQVYLLEKSRVTRHDSEERTFHIFYQLLSSPDKIKTKFWSGLKGKTNADFKYVGSTDTTTIEGMSDAEQFEHTLQSLAIIGIEGQVLTSFFQAICVVLQLGNLTFGPPSNGDTDKSVCTSPNELNSVASLMGIPPQILATCLTQRAVKVRGETTLVPLLLDAAKDSTDALAKQLYDRVFLWLVKKINQATSTTMTDTRRYGIIGLLDIFGFESFPVNSFEQLCINYANEQLQQKFTKDVFISVYAEYKEQGIALDEITYDDNTHVLDLIQNKTGLLNMLNEECIRPNGSDYGFVNKALHANGKSPALIIPRIKNSEVEFGIRHYAGDVIYDATGFVTKNQDTLPTDLMECAQTSTNEIIAKEIGLQQDDPTTGRGGPKRKQSNLVAPTAWSKYKGSLTTLMSNLNKSQSRYIRCVKPNILKKPCVIEHELTLQQLRSSGVVSAVTLARSAFPNRLEHSLILDRFFSLYPRAGRRVKNGKDSDLERSRKESEMLLTHTLQSLEEKESDGKIRRAFVIGRTKAYFRAGALEYLEAARLKGMEGPAIKIQKIYRGHLARTQTERRRIKEQMARYEACSSSAVAIQCAWRCVLARALLAEKIEAGRERAELEAELHLYSNAATTIQCMVRIWLALKEKDRRYVKQIKSQAKALKKKKKQRKLDAAATTIQRHLRGLYIRASYGLVIEKTKERAHMKEKLKKIQKKISFQQRKRDKEIEQLSQGPRLASRELWESEMIRDEDENTELSEMAQYVEFLQSEHRQLQIQQKTLEGMMKPLRKNFSTLMEENEKLRKDFEDAHKKNERVKQRNKDLIERREMSEKKIESIKVELEELSKKFAPASSGRQDFQRGFTAILKLIQDRCTDQQLVDECYNIGYEVQADVNELQSHTTATYEIQLQESPTHVKRRLEMEGFLTLTPSTGKDSRKKKLHGSFSALQMNNSFSSLNGSNSKLLSKSLSNLKMNGSVSNIGSPGVLKKGKRGGKKLMNPPL